MFRPRSTLCCAALVLVCVLVCVLADVDADPLACGGQLTQEAGQIVSPNYPGQYPVNADCSWVITVQPGKIIDLKFLTLDLEDAYQRCTDYVGLYNGPSLQDAIVSGDLCLASSERQYRSRGNQMLVHFHSDNTVSRTGFSATYKTVDCPPFTYGRDGCNQPCSCVQENTLYCNSVNGSCACKPGWTSADCSVDINKCSNPHVCSGLYSVCVNKLGGYNCSCLNGMQLNVLGQCVDQHVCKTQKCSHVCGIENSKEKCYCPKGMTLDPTDNTTCRACPAPNYGKDCSSTCNCLGRGTCDPVRGCVCVEQWTGPSCELDVDECARPNTCPAGRLCVNEQGSFSCQCPDGYFMDSGVCTDIDECSGPQAVLRCNNTEVCVNNRGSFSCDCKPGYARDSSQSQCQDIDECDSTTTNNCHQVCTNFDGGYVCSCHPGYMYDASANTCVACPAPNYGKDCSSTCNCLGRGTCDPVRGCVCVEQWTGSSCELDVDECARPNTCPAGRLCVNDQGSFSCQCPDGYFMDSGVCTDIDECDSTTTNNCHQVCTNFDGGYVCSCHPGYMYDASANTCVVTEVVQTVITLEYDVSDIDLTDTNSSSYTDLRLDVETQMSSKLSFEMKVTVSVTVNRLSRGSLIADTYISVPKEAVADPNKIVTKALLRMMNEGGLQFNSRLAPIISTKVANHVFKAGEGRCEQLQKYNPCDGTCQEVNDEAFCVSAKDDDSNLNVRLIIGLSVSMFVLLCIIVAFVVFYCTKKRRKSRERRHKTEESEVNKNHDIVLHNIGKRFSPDTDLYDSPYDRPESEIYDQPRSVLHHNGPDNPRYSSLVGKADQRPKPDVYSNIRVPRINR